MRKFWWGILKRTPLLAWNSAHHLDGILGVALIFAAIAGPFFTSVEDAEGIQHWLAANYKWLWVALIVLFFRLVMKAVYEKYEAQRAEFAKQSSEYIEEMVRAS